MAYYCTNCGTPLDAEGRCPRCDAAPTPSAALGAFTPPIPGPYDHRPKFEPVLPGEEDEGTTVLKSDDMPEFESEYARFHYLNHLAEAICAVEGNTEVAVQGLRHAHRD